MQGLTINSATAQSSSSAATAESVLDALSTGLPPTRRSAMPAEDWQSPSADAREGLIGPEMLLGHWVDSQGNAVHVLSTDAYAMRLTARLSRPARADINLALK